MLQFDYTQALQDTLGSAGISSAQLAEARPKSLAALAKLQAMHAVQDVNFLHLPESDLTTLVARAEADRARFADVVVLGIGGSSLGAKAAYTALFRRYSRKTRDGRTVKAPRIHFLENVDPVETADLLESLDLEHTLVNVVTKSGTTIETMSAFFLFRERLIEQFGMDGYRERVVATTDPAKGEMRALVERDGLFSFVVPPGVGGRFSVLSAVGLYPLAVAGVDVTALLAGAKRARDLAVKDDSDANLALRFAALQVALYESGVTDLVLMPYCTGLADTAAWFIQLWAESLGKGRPDGSRVGPTPIAAVGATDQHSQLQLFMEGIPNKNVVFIGVQQPAVDLVVPTAAGVESLAHLSGKSLNAILWSEMRGVRAGLREAGRATSVLTIPVLDAAAIGELFMTFEAATAFAGFMFGINPFDQPGVELGKLFAHGLLGKESEAKYAEKIKSYGL